MKTGSMGQSEVMVTMEEQIKSEELTETLITVGKKSLPLSKIYNPKLKSFPMQDQMYTGLATKKGLLEPLFGPPSTRINSL